MGNDGLLDEAEMTRLLRISPSTARQWRHQAKGPRYLKVGRKALYRRSSLEEWLAAQERQGTKERDG